MNNFTTINKFESQYDFTTSNDSFIKMTNKLKEEGIKKYRFPLTLYDVELAGVDPYSRNISEDIKDKIIKESRKNLWYFLREIVRICPVNIIQDAEEIELESRFELTKANCAQAFCALNKRSSWVSAPRMKFKTISSLCIALWELISSDEPIYEGSIEFFTNSKRFKEAQIKIPYYLSSEVIQHTVGRIDTNYIGDSGVKQSFKLHCNKAIMHVPDAEFIQNIDVLCENIKNDNNVLYWLFESTFFSAYEQTGAKNILDKCVAWSEEFYDNIDDLPRDRIVNILYHIEDLEKDPELYINDMESLLLHDKMFIVNEVLLKRETDDNKKGRNIIFISGTFKDK